MYVVVKKGFTINGEQYRKNSELKFRRYENIKDDSQVLGRLYKKDGVFTLFHIDKEFFDEYLEYK